MGHKEAYETGKITKKQYLTLQALKNFGHLKKYRALEKKLGIK